MAEATLTMDWPPQPGDLMLLRVEHQWGLITPPAGWTIMGRWRLRHEQLWSRVVVAGDDSTTVTVTDLTGKATLSLLRRGELIQVAWRQPA